MAQPAWVTMTHARRRRFAAAAVACVDAGVEELSEMTIGRTDDPENPVTRNGRPTRPRHCLGPGRGPHLGQRHAAAPTGRTHDRNRTARQFSQLLLLHPRGRPHMRVAHRPARPTRDWMKGFSGSSDLEEEVTYFLVRSGATKQSRSRGARRSERCSHEIACAPGKLVWSSRWKSGPGKP